MKLVGMIPRLGVLPALSWFYCAPCHQGRVLPHPDMNRVDFNCVVNKGSLTKCRSKFAIDAHLVPSAQLRTYKSPNGSSDVEHLQ